MESGEVDEGVGPGVGEDGGEGEGFVVEGAEWERGAGDLWGG